MWSIPTVRTALKRLVMAAALIGALGFTTVRSAELSYGVEFANTRG